MFRNGSVRLCVEQSDFDRDVETCGQFTNHRSRGWEPFFFLLARCPWKEVGMGRSASRKAAEEKGVFV